MKVLEAIETLKNVDEGAKANVQETRRIKGMKVGQIVRQGDIYIHMVKDTHPHGKRSKNHQLAMGNTQGSRHIAPVEAEVYEGKKSPEWAPNALLGPLFKLFKRATVTHPEHAHIDLETGCYQVTHQLDLKTLERVKD